MTWENEDILKGVVSFEFGDVVLKTCEPCPEVSPAAPTPHFVPVYVFSD